MDSDSIPRGSETLLDVIHDAEESGFGAQQIARDEGMIECVACTRLSPASAFEVVAHRRLEGMSDAADMLLVVMSRCPACSQGGVLTLGYGPNATEVDVETLECLDLDG